MKLGLARTLFLASSLIVATLAMAAWDEPGPKILTENRLGLCPVPPTEDPHVGVEPDQDLLLFLFSLSQGLRGQN